MGTEANPYIIGTAEELAYLASSVNAGTTYSGIYFRLANDIVLNDTTAAYWTLNATEWTPIGVSTTKLFLGTLDGAGYSVSGIYIDGTSSYQGLFGYSGGTVMNLSVVDSYIEGIEGIAGIVGYNTGTISGCRSTATVAGSNNVGGIAGYNNPATFSGNSNAGKVSGLKYVGGVVGANVGTVDDCSNSGSVDGAIQVGGVAGRSTGVMSNCSNVGVPLRVGAS